MQQEIDRGLGRPMARNAGAQERKLDANGIGWYSDVRVVALERRADLICALFGRGPEWVVAGCAPVSAAYRLADSLMTNRSLRVYLDHTRRYPPVHRQETFRITHIQP
ncbi:hypothetical protein D554_1956 [Bordetella holmesii 30539]|uniref:Uncharacterized protein n=3 Tax=Bordetella holmesii TaxID=35814 RepID=A0A158M755_9BORD|nr:hypothetical protein D560_0756 [Bordetella holmesii ATCC 51541]EWM48816.1 hypothetical protein D556_0751 [Bordetella holmesii 41130]EXF86707.1 hypothetical protein D554_1956 [Bordetella holmesii 30539]EXX95267.1 hypothetical protein D559_2698 [Bordetella holmesii 1058]KAK67568.1 hypothetical protein L573_1638 [Bordetella holmesii H620]KAK82384.1 hypothetical protein L503_2437 [Bordetella holmesii CDC-H809-BH]KAK85699.1 hypothetical protein L496_2397 [Bordetella holmesii CDC-H572-BH]KAK959